MSWPTSRSPSTAPDRSESAAASGRPRHPLRFSLEPRSRARRWSRPKVRPFRVIVAESLPSIVQRLPLVEAELCHARGNEVFGNPNRLPRFVGRWIEILAVVRRCTAVLHRVQPPAATAARLVAIPHQPSKRRDHPSCLRGAAPVARNNTRPCGMEHRVTGGVNDRHRRPVGILALQFDKMRCRLAPGVHGTKRRGVGWLFVVGAARLAQGTSTPSRRMSSASSLADVR